MEDEKIVENLEEEKKKTTTEMRKERRAKRKKINWIVQVVVLAVSVILVFVAIFAKQGLTPGTPMYELIDQNIGKFFDLQAFFVNRYPTIIETFAILLLMWSAQIILCFIVDQVTKWGNRSRTIGHLTTSLIKYGAVFVAILLVLQAWGVPQSTILAAVGIIGLALSLGAQNLIDDILSGLSIIFEKQFLLGDIVEIDGFRGEVVEIGVRVTKLLDTMGDIKTISNADIRASLNMSLILTPIVVDLLLPHSITLTDAEKAFERNFEKMAAAIPNLKGPITYNGVQSISEAGIEVRFITYVNEVDKFGLRRELNRQIKLMAERENIPLQIRTVVVRKDESNR